MAKYLLLGSYTADGTKGVLKDGGTGRRKAVEQALKSVGGSMEALYFAFGEADAVVIADLPDNVSAAALSLMVNASGLASARTVVLLTAEEMDQATKKTVKYRAPGK
jgi:uncharacterized protein with GYD domain